MNITSLTACQKSKLSIAEALAVGTENEAPALWLGRIVSCHSLVGQITKRGLLFDCVFFFSSHASQPAWSALSVWVDWIYCWPPKSGGYRVVAVIQQRTWTNGKAMNHLNSLQSLPMQLCELEIHIRISRNLKKCV